MQTVVGNCSIEYNLAEENDKVLTVSILSKLGFSMGFLYNSETNEGSSFIYSINSIQSTRYISSGMYVLDIPLYNDLLKPLQTDDMATYANRVIDFCNKAEIFQDYNHEEYTIYWNEYNIGFKINNDNSEIIKIKLVEDDGLEVKIYLHKAVPITDSDGSILYYICKCQCNIDGKILKDINRVAIVAL